MSESAKPMVLDDVLMEAVSRTGTVTVGAVGVTGVSTWTAVTDATVTAAARATPFATRFPTLLILNTLRTLSPIPRLVVADSQPLETNKAAALRPNRFVT